MCGVLGDPCLSGSIMSQSIKCRVGWVNLVQPSKSDARKECHGQDLILYPTLFK